MDTAIEKPRVVVIGSANMDLVVRCDRLPMAGETVLGGNFAAAPGGKGANQAVAAARLGADCFFVGRVGNDDFGNRLAMQMQTAGVDTTHLVITEGLATGVASIVVDGKGENAIVVAGGANAAMTPQDVDDVEDLIASAKAVLLQLELPVETVSRAIELARKHGVLAVLDPAPAREDLPAELFEVDILNPNQGEAAMLAGEPVRGDRHSAKLAATTLIRKGARAVVIKLGRKGAVLVDGDRMRFREIPSHEVSVLDTTAAGDAFAAALTVARAEGLSLPKAAEFAAAAGAIACTRVGAMSAMPTLQEVQKLLARKS